MHGPLSYYALLARRWAWLVILGVVICGGTTYIITKQIPPTYRASTTIIVNLTATASSASDNVNASELVAPTYAQLLTSPQILNPVVAQHRGLTLAQLNTMVTAKVQSNTTLIEIDVTNRDPDLAMQLANEIAQSFQSYTNTQLPGNVIILPAERPLDPIGLKPSLYAVIAALVGLGLALSLIVIFEWLDDRVTKPEELQELLGVDILTALPSFLREQRHTNVREQAFLAEEYGTLCFNLRGIQDYKPFKSLMITSALTGEGKSTIAANLASFLATGGKRVLLVDADLRRAVVDQYFQLDHFEGLSDALLEKRSQLETILQGQETDKPTLRVLTAGKAPTNPAVLLQSPSVDRVFDYFAGASFDYIIFDAPPLLPVADAQILASHIQATVLVVDAAKTPRRALRRSRQVLSKTNTMLAGVVINKSPWPEADERRHYLSSTRPGRIASTKTTPTDPVVTITQEALTVDEVADLDATIILPLHQKPEVENP